MIEYFNLLKHSNKEDNKKIQKPKMKIGKKKFAIKTEEEKLVTESVLEEVTPEIIEEATKNIIAKTQKPALKKKKVMPKRSY